MTETQFGELDRIVLSFNRLFCDLKLQVQIAKQKVIAGYIAYQSEDYCLLGVLCCQQFSSCRFSGASIAPEEIHLKDNVGSERKNVGLDAFSSLATAKGGVDRNLWKLVGARDSDLSSGGIDALDGQLQIVVLLQRCADEFLQFRVVEDLPPWQIGERFGLHLRLLRFVGAVEGGGRLHNGPVIVRPYRACRKHECRHDEDESKSAFRGLRHFVPPPCRVEMKAS